MSMSPTVVVQLHACRAQGRLPGRSAKPLRAEQKRLEVHAWNWSIYHPSPRCFTPGRQFASYETLTIFYFVFYFEEFCVLCCVFVCVFWRYTIGGWDVKSRSSAESACGKQEPNQNHTYSVHQSLQAAPECKKKNDNFLNSLKKGRIQKSEAQSYNSKNPNQNR